MPDVKPQDYIEAEHYITKVLRDRGYIVQGLGYHSYFSEVAKATIVSLNEPTPLYIRTLPDRLVIGETRAILIEIKDASTRVNISIEAFPFIISRHLYREFNILTLYLFFNGVDIDITGDFVHNLQIDRVIIPLGRNAYQSSYWFDLLKESFPAIEEVERIETIGSKDPLLIINKDKRQFFKPLGDLLSLMFSPLNNPL